LPWHDRPFLRIRLFPHWLDGDHERIEKPMEFQNRFRKGDHVLRLHFHATAPREMALLLQRMTALFPKMKKSGLAGVFTDTPNQVIADYLVKRLSGIEAKPPAVEAEKARKAYATHPEYPQEYSMAPVRRIIIPFLAKKPRPKKQKRTASPKKG
jgi:hypothetical protein